MKTLKNIKNYSLGFVVGVACVSSIAYGASNGSIGASFSEVSAGVWKLIGTNITNDSITSAQLGLSSVTNSELATNSVTQPKVSGGYVDLLNTQNNILGVKTFVNGIVANVTGDLTGNVTGNATTATRLQTSRTIAGVGFDGTANISIPFNNLSSKPTTIGGYAITDAVTTHSDQSISGIKTFTSNMTLPGAPTTWYNLNVGSIGSTTTYAYTALCSQNSNGDCTGNGGVVLGLANPNAGVNFATSGNSFVNNGNFGVGTNSPSFRLDVNGQARATGGFVGNLTGNADTVTNGVYTNNTQTITGQKTFSSQILANGGIQSTSFIYTSDRRFKENIETIQSPLKTVQALRGVTWNWKKDGKADVGFIAQEVEEVLPELVYTDKNGYKGVQYGNMVGLLVEAVKEQQKQIDELNEKLNSLQK